MNRLTGIEIGGTKLQIVLADSPAQIVRRWRADADRSGGPAIQRQIAAGLAEILRGERATAVAIGFGGPVDSRTGRIVCSHQIAGWDGFPIRDWIADLAHCPAIAENDSNLATLAEAIHGAGAGFDPVFYANFGSGVGGGLVVGGKIFHGTPPGEMEFGHVRLNPAGLTVEDACSGWAIDARLRTLAREYPDSLLADRIAGPAGGEARHLASLLAGGEPLARRVIEELGSTIAFALSHVVHLVHPQIIIIGGGLSHVGEPLRAAVEADLTGKVMKAFHPAPKICLSALQDDAVPIGALELAARIARIE